MWNKISAAPIPIGTYQMFFVCLYGLPYINAVRFAGIPFSQDPNYFKIIIDTFWLKSILFQITVEYVLCIRCVYGAWILNHVHQYVKNWISGRHVVQEWIASIRIKLLFHGAKSFHVPVSSTLCFVAKLCTASSRNMPRPNGFMCFSFFFFSYR